MKQSRGAFYQAPSCCCGAALGQGIVRTKALHCRVERESGLPYNAHFVEVARHAGIIHHPVRIARS